MSKKRVHELAKQLKEQGIELSNQELVDRLHQFGFDVKSHSSSLDDDQAQTAFERIVGEKKPKAAPVRPAGPGFVVRKKAHVEPAAEPVVEAAPPAPPPVEAVAPELPADEEPEAPAAETAQPAAEPAPVATGGEAAPVAAAAAAPS